VNLTSPLPSTQTPRFDRVVSLGRSCQPAWQIRRFTGVEDAQVLDWVITSDAALTATLASGFDGWFHKDRLDFQPGRQAVDRMTGVRFIHEFENAEGLEDGHHRNSGRIIRLLMRWRVLMHSGERLLFVRSHSDDADVLGCANRLVDLLMQSTSNPFELLYLVPPNLYHPNLRLDDVQFAALDPKPEGTDWKGDSLAWDRVLIAAGAPSASRRAA
jgi:Putative papain-like cysteine peptidase (DUF1796)